MKYKIKRVDNRIIRENILCSDFYVCDEQYEYIDSEKMYRVSLL
jgi:hypothetical protein